LVLLHKFGSNNPLGLNATGNDTTFNPGFTSKDYFAFLLVLNIYGFFVFLEPNLLGHPDNYIKANPLVTPLHIVPE